MQRIASAILLIALASSCRPTNLAPAIPTDDGIRVIAAETFLQDIVQQIAGRRLEIISLIPLGLDPHNYELSPQDVARLEDSDALFINGSGFETWLDNLIGAINQPELEVIEASEGIPPREPFLPADGPQSTSKLVDPHFWLDPVLVKAYVDNITLGLSKVDPPGEMEYKKNSAEYIQKLDELDQWIRKEINRIPVSQRLIVTNHESFGYFADRYGFQVIGTVLPSANSGAAPSAKQLVAIIEAIQATQTRAIFLETGADPKLAEQISEETGVAVVTDLFTHSLSAPGGPASNYIDMMRYNTNLIVNALTPDSD